MRYPLLYILIYLFIVVFVDLILYLLILISLYLSDYCCLVIRMIQRNLKQAVPYSLTMSDIHSGVITETNLSLSMQRTLITR